jgi:hypothetical protein
MCLIELNRVLEGGLYWILFSQFTTRTKRFIRERVPEPANDGFISTPALKVAQVSTTAILDSLLRMWRFYVASHWEGPNVRLFQALDCGSNRIAETEQQSCS